MNPRIVRQTTVKGCFTVPIGVKFLSHEPMNSPRFVEVSTVCLDGGHLEDPLGWCEPETGYETMVFLRGCTFFSVFTQKYETRRAAAQGHRSVVKKLLKGTLPLSVPLAYRAWEEMTPDAAKSDEWLNERSGRAA